MFVISLAMFLVMLYINSNLVLEKKEIIATLSVGDEAGFDINNTVLTFGMITSNSQRILTIENTYDFPIKLEFEVEGNIKKRLKRAKVKA